MWWLLIAQTQYQKMSKGCEEILRQSKDVHNSRKLWKAVAIYKTNKLGLRRDQRKYLTQKVAGSTLILFNQLIKYSMFLVSLWARIITHERTLNHYPKLLSNSLNPTHIADAQSTHPSFISRCLLKTNQLLYAWLTTICKGKIFEEICQ